MLDETTTSETLLDELNRMIGLSDGRTQVREALESAAHVIERLGEPPKKAKEIEKIFREWGPDSHIEMKGLESALKILAMPTCETRS